MELAADITGELLAPAANVAYPELANALVVAGRRAAGSEEAARLAASLASRTDSYALPTSRAEWRRGLGLPASTSEQTEAGGTQSRSDDLGALVLSDGQRIVAKDIGSHTRTVDDIVALRRKEASESRFYWPSVVAGRVLTSDDVRKLSEVFRSDAMRDQGVLVRLAEAAESNGDPDTALSLASNAFDGASGDSWLLGGVRLRAAAIMVRLGDQDALGETSRDLVRQATGSLWFPGRMLSSFESIADALAPSLSASSLWPAIRVYLDGIAEELDLGDSEVLSDHGCRWWLPPPTRDRRAPGGDSTSAAALAELAVGHLSHPAWLVRDAATVVVVRALVAGNEEVAEALGRFAQLGASDDTLERAGRCVAAARSDGGYTLPAALQSLERILADHPSQVIRDLASDRSPKAHRPLSPAYRLAVSGSARPGAVFLGPHELQYRILAGDLGFDVDAVLAIAARYASETLAVLPEQQAVLAALSSSGMEHVHPLEKVAASRAAFGRVLADLTDAGLLDGAPQHRHVLRTVDVDVVTRVPTRRPSVVPAPPAAGIDRSVEDWQSGLSNRLEKHIAASTEQERVLIGARSRLTVLNWSHLEEELECGTTIGTNATTADRVLARGLPMLQRDLVSTPEPVRRAERESLLIENPWIFFHQARADWLSFRPDLAEALTWTPDANRPGCWHTASGDLAVELIYWVDGWWGRSGPAFDDTEALGHAVVLTTPGLSEVVAAFGELTRHFVLTRVGRSDGAELDPVSATRSLRVASPST